MAGFAERKATLFSSNKINSMGQQEANVKSKWRAERLEMLNVEIIMSWSLKSLCDSGVV